MKSKTRDNPNSSPAYEEPAEAGTTTVVYASACVDPSALDSGALRDALFDALRAHRASCHTLSALFVQASQLPADRRWQLAHEIVEGDPESDARSPVRLFLEQTGVRPSPSRPDAAALEALERLARFYVPYAPPLASPDAVNAFVDRMEAVLGELLEGTAALRFAYLSETEAEPPSDPQLRDLAARLLDWTGDRRVLDSLRSQLSAMVGHHRRLVADALASFDRVLARLKPADIEAEALLRPWNPWRYRGLWREVVRRHDELLRTRSDALGRTLSSVAEALGVNRHSPAAHRQAASVLPRPLAAA